TVPLGLFELGDAQKSIVVDGGVTTLEQLRNVPIPVAGPAGLTTVPLKDVAALTVAGESESISRTNGVESIGVQIVKAQDANAVDVVNAAKEAAETFRGKYPSLEVTTLLDQGEPIEQSVKTMLEKAAFGAIFAVI